MKTWKTDMRLADQKVFSPKKQQAGFQSDSAEGTDPLRTQEAVLWDPSPLPAPAWPLST